MAAENETARLLPNNVTLSRRILHKKWGIHEARPFIDLVMY